MPECLGLKKYEEITLKIFLFYNLCMSTKQSQNQETNPSEPFTYWNTGLSIYWYPYLAPEAL